MDLQAQVLLDPVPNRRQRPLRRCLTAPIDVAIIGITAVGVPTPVQFLIERVQVDVGRQGRQDSPNAKGNFEFERRLEFLRKSGAR